MFKKKYCKNCGEKINHKSNFCPECGYPLKEKQNYKKDDYGMLGKNDMPDEFQEIDKISNSIFSGFGGKIMNRMLNNTMKMLEKEMEKSTREIEKQNNQNPNFQNHFELFINGKRVNPENIKVSKAQLLMPGKNPSERQFKKEIPKNIFFSKDKKEQFLKFEKTEPKTELKRFSDKIIYEVFLPGVKSIEDVSIIQLESSIEIKAVSNSKKKSYSKIIPVGMKIANYFLEKGILVLEI